MLFFSERTFARVVLHSAALACAFAAAGCAAGTSPDSSDDQGSGGSGGGEPGARIRMGITDSAGQPVEFEDDARLVRQPNSSTAIWLETEPFRLVRTTLLPNGAQTPGSAALDWTERDSEAEGRLTLRLMAPSMPTSFLLRAWVDSANGMAAIPPKQVEVTIAQLGSANVQVIPLYVGKRPITRWNASATVDQTCSNLPGAPPPDGGYANEMLDPPPLDAVTIPSVPAGPPLAVTIRAASYAWGCANLAQALEGLANSVQVTVTDVPMHLGTRPILLDLSLTSRADWTALFDAPIAAALDATLDGASDDVDALLDAMQASLGTAGRNEFSTTREAAGWDLQLRAALGAAAATSVRAPLERWMRAGLADMDLDRAFESELVADSAGRPRLTLEESFGFGAESVGARFVDTPSFSADSRDSVLLGANLEIDPARLLLASARAKARDEVDDADGVSEAIAELMSCDSVADTLIGYGLNAGTANADCDAECAVELCRDAVAELVARANDASEDELGQIELAVSGPGQVGQEAELSLLDGSWLGKLTLGDVTADLSGNATASTE